MSPNNKKNTIVSGGAVVSPTTTGTTTGSSNTSIRASFLPLTIIFWFTLGVFVGTTITSSNNSTSLFVQYLKEPLVAVTTTTSSSSRTNLALDYNSDNDSENDSDTEIDDFDTDNDNNNNNNNNNKKKKNNKQKQLRAQQSSNKVSQVDNNDKEEEKEDIIIDLQQFHKERMIKYQYTPPKIIRTIDEIHTLASMNECGDNNNNIGTTIDYTETFFQLNSTVRSRLQEDRLIYNLFFNNMTIEEMHNKQYHYVEIGAFDGMGESNTRFYDVCLGWDGLLIEPNPTIYPKLLQNRKFAHRVSFAASCSIQDEIQHNTTVGFYATRFTNAVQDNSENRKAYEGKVQTVQVPCGSLTPVLEDVFSSNKRIHFFSLDTEGVEPLIIKNINFAKIYIDVLIAESENTFCRRNEPCEARNTTRHLMTNLYNYDLFENIIPKSDLYVHQQSEFRSKVNHLTPSTRI